MPTWKSTDSHKFVNSVGKHDDASYPFQLIMLKRGSMTLHFLKKEGTVDFQSSKEEIYFHNFSGSLSIEIVNLSIDSTNCPKNSLVERTISTKEKVDVVRLSRSLRTSLAPEELE